MSEKPEDLLDENVDLMTVARLTREQKELAGTMGRREARFLVDSYYQFQEYRKAAANQIRAGEAFDDAAYPLVDWLAGHTASIELRLKNLLGAYAEGNPVGRWSQSIHGIGPVISAGLLAHIDITLAPTVGHIWRFAGQDPTSEWRKGERRPWNAKLKVICYFIGESFVKVSNSDKDFYGHLWAERKAYEQARNEAGDYADQAATILATRKFKARPTPPEEGEAAAEDFKRAAEWYSHGQLPPAHIHARSKRWTVKLFLAHWHEVAWECRYGEKPVKPYVLTLPNHAHKITVPNWPQ